MMAPKFIVARGVSLLLQQVTDQLKEGRRTDRIGCPPAFALVPTSVTPERKSVAVRVGEIRIPAAIGVDDRLLLHELDTE